MAKPPERSEAAETAAGSQAPKKDRRRVPRTAASQPATIQQAPGDAIASRSAAADRRTPTEEEIRARAYQMYLERGGEDGMDFDDWLRAERELTTRR
jgi:DUF2934 family protein